jgi:hypothetical protein
MIKQIFKAILMGLLIGVAFFMMPLFLVSAIFRLGWGGRRRRWRYAHHYAFADKIRNMSDEEYDAFKTKTQGRGCGPHHYGYYSHQNCNDWNRNKEENKNTNDQQ